MKKPRVALVTDNPHFIRQQLPEWEKRFNLRVFAPPPPPVSVTTATDLRAVAAFKLRNRLRLPRLARWADVVFCEWATHYLVWFTRHRCRARIATRLHRFELQRHGSEIVWDRVALVVFVSEAMERRFRKVVPAFTGRTAVAYDNVDFAAFPLKEREPTYRLGALGQLTPRKRIYGLVLAFAEAIKRLPELRLSIAGNYGNDVTYQQWVRELVARLGLGERVAFEGHVDNLIEWYHSLDCIISNSWHEGAQTSLVEGITAACWPLSHNWDGAAELVPPESLYETEAGFVSALETYYTYPPDERWERTLAHREALLARLRARPRLVELIAELMDVH